MEIKILNPTTVHFSLSPLRAVDVIIYGHEARILAYGVDTDGAKIPTSLFESEIEGFIQEARRQLSIQPLPNPLLKD